MPVLKDIREYKVFQSYFRDVASRVLNTAVFLGARPHIFRSNKILCTFFSGWRESIFSIVINGLIFHFGSGANTKECCKKISVISCHSDRRKCLGCLALNNF